MPETSLPDPAAAREPPPFDPFADIRAVIADLKAGNYAPPLVAAAEAHARILEKIYRDAKRKP